MTNINVKRPILTGMVSVAALMLVSCGDQGSNTETSMDNSLEGIHERVVTLDSHVDIHEDMTFDPIYDPGSNDIQQVDITKMEEGGLDSAHFIVYVAQTKRTPEGYALAKEKALRKFSAIHRMTEHYPDRIGFANTPDEFDAIVASGRKVAMIGIENGYVIGKDISLVEDYYNRGARYMTLAHNGHNDICDSASPLPALEDAQEEHGGVSEFGYTVIDEMNRVGMMVDISHVSVKCMMQATEHSKAPVIASHSSVYALAGHRRNLTDEQLKAVAATDGVVQIVGLGSFVKHQPARGEAISALGNEAAAGSPEYEAGMAAIEAEYPEGVLKDFIDHIVYAVDLIGVDHVGIVSDFDGGGGLPGWNSAAETMNVTKALIGRGYNEEEIGKIWSGNMIATWRRVDEAAAKLN